MLPKLIGCDKLHDISVFYDLLDFCVKNLDHPSLEMENICGKYLMIW